jgi:hypothetical protein
VASENRLVPFMGAAPGAGQYPTVGWSSIHPQEQYSELLNRLRMNAGRTIDEKILCPPGGTLP